MLTANSGSWCEFLPGAAQDSLLFCINTYGIQPCGRCRLESVKNRRDWQVNTREQVVR